MHKIILILVLILAGFSNTYASHLMGGEITYTHVSGDDYEVTLVVYRDCDGITLSTTQTVTFESASCGQNFGFTIPFIQAIDISQVCPGQATTCNGGSTPGTEQHIFRGIVTLPPCTDWIMHWNNGTRNATIQNLVNPDLENIYIQNTLNNVVGTNNNSPQFFNVPTPYLCANNLAIYSHAASDPDGDSLYYSFNQPLGTPGPPGTPIAYMPGYTINQPMTTVSGMNLDQTTGEMCFTPDVGQIVVVSVIIEEFRNGALIGSQIREMQIVVDPGCTNSNPTTGVAATCGGAATLTLTVAGPSVIQTDPNSVVMCPNDSVCFEVNFSDPDGDNITLNSNALAAMPTASFTVVGNGTPNPVATFCWLPTPLDSGLNVFAIIAEDDACPIIGMQSFVFDVTVLDRPYAGLDDTICGNQEAQLQASGGAGYVWSVISGDPIVPGTNFSCVNCSNPVATPSITTTYLLVSTQAAACSNTDTVTIVVVPDFVITTTQTDNFVCLNETVDFTTSINPAGSYFYSWTPSAILNNATISDPTATFNTPGLTTLAVTVDDGDGCILSDTLTVDVAPTIVPDITILTPDSLIECEDSVLIDLDLGGGIPGITGPSATNICSGPVSQNIIGVGTTNITNYPTPFNGFWHDSRVQIIYTPAEIIAAGFSGGKITEMGWYITSIGGQTYNGFTIKMGVPPVNDFSATTTFIPGLTQVYTTANFAPTGIGWTTHTLNTAFDWDGVSNLIIEVCFDNTAYSTRDNVAQTTTPAKMVLYDYTDNSVGCTLNTPNNSNDQFNRPNIRFTSCPTTPDPADFIYSWTPNVEITTANIQNPLLHPTFPTTYVVTVTDLTGSCFDTDSIDISVNCPTCDQPGITVVPPTCKDGTDGKIIIDPVFQLGSEIHTYTYSDSITSTVLQTTTNVVAGMQDSLINIGAGAYMISLLDTNGCFKDTTIWVTEPDSVSINSTSPDETICINESTPINATAAGGNGGPYTFTWTDLNTNIAFPATATSQTVSPTDPSTCYSVFATDQMGCISNSSSSVCINLYPELIASTPEPTITICQNTSTDLQINATGGSGVGYEYEWFENGISIGFGSTFNVTPTVSPTVYTGVVTDNCSTPSDNITVTVDWPGTLDISFERFPVEDSCYSTNPIEFTNTSTPTSYISTSEWTISDGTTGFGNTFSTPFNASRCYDVTLTVNTIHGCEVEITYPCFVQPHSYPDTKFTMSPPITDLFNTEIDFENYTTGNEPLTYEWNFNSGLPNDMSTEENPKFTYSEQEPNSYPVVLTVTDVNGCVSSTTATVIVNSIYQFYLPSTFTPNNDGLNDTFRAYGEGIDLSKYSMYIYNRWGELVFHTDNIGNGWDGHYKGDKAKVGTYVWKIVAKEKHSTIIHDHHGHVTITK